MTALIASAAALAARYALIERDDLGPICGAASAPWWCALRMALIQAFLNDVFGRVSVVLAALALWRRSALPAHLGKV